MRRSVRASCTLTSTRASLSEVYESKIQKFSNISSLLKLPYKLTIELTFENFCRIFLLQSHRGVSLSEVYESDARVKLIRGL